MNVNQLKSALPILFKARVTPLIVGHRGIGKSTIVKQYAKDNDMDLIDIRLGLMSDSGDLIGLPDFVKEGGNTVATKFAKPSFLPTGGKGILFLDEINRAPKELLQAVFQLVLDRRIGEYELPEGWEVVCAMNPPTEEYTVLDFSDSAFSDRFCQIAFKPSPKDWIEYASKRGINESIISFIQDQNDALSPKLSDFNLEVAPSQRTWELFDGVEKLCNDQNLLQEIALGMIGLEQTSAYFSHLKDFKGRIKGVDVIDNFKDIEDVLKKHCEVETLRTDLINVIGNEIVETIEEREGKLGNKQQLNVAKFLGMIPKDLSIKIIRDLWKIRSFIDSGLILGTNDAGKKLVELMS